MNKITKMQSLTVSKPFNIITVKVGNYVTDGDEEIEVGEANLELAPHNIDDEVIDNLGIRPLVVAIWDVATQEVWANHLANVVPEAPLNPTA